MKRIYLASPLSGDVERNCRYLMVALADSFRRDEAPFAPHAVYPQVLDDTVQEERAKGMTAGESWLSQAEALVAYIDLGISRGMRAEIETASELGIRVEFRELGKWE